uniref:Uncharacterized protein n=1 Tax=Oryza nivara TaxID=4536 RepID=A0A0E0G295_ORYNI
MAAATAPATATKLAVAVYVEEAAGAPVGAETEEGVTADGVTAEGALAAGASVGGAGGDALGDGDAAVGGVATGAGAVAGDLAGGAGSGAILGAGTGAAPGACAAAVTARRATMAATTAKRAMVFRLGNRHRVAGREKRLFYQVIIQRLVPRWTVPCCADRWPALRAVTAGPANKCCAVLPPSAM